MRNTATLCLVLWSFSPAPPAHAQSAENRAAADVLFKEARALVEEKKFADACPKFAASQKLDPKPGRLLALGDCYEQKGNTASAWATFREAVSAAKTTSDEAREQEGQRRADLLEPQLSKLIIRVPSEARVAGLEVRRNGTILDATLWDMAIPVDPGPQLIDARAQGKQSWSLEVDIPSKSGTTTTDIPVLVDSASKTGSVGTATRRGKSVPLIIAGGALGVLGIGSGIAFVAVASGLKNDALEMRDAMPEAACNPTHPMHNDYLTKCSDLASNLDRKDTLWNAGAILLPVGGAFAIGTWIYTLIPASKINKSAFAVTPIIRPQFHGVVMAGVF